MPKSRTLASLVWNQHFEQVDGRVRGPSRKRDTEWVGYKVHLTETCGEDEAVHLIVQAEISAATEQDVEETMPRLA